MKMEKVSVASHLPSEVLNLIFSHPCLNVFDLIGIENVCQKWKTVCQRDVGLWKDRMFQLPIIQKNQERRAIVERRLNPPKPQASQTGDEAMDAKKYLKALRICTNRCGKSGIESITLPILNMNGDQTMIEKIFLDFPAKSLRNLEIYVTSDAQYNLYLNNTVAKYVAKTLGQCCHLETIYLEIQIGSEEVEHLFDYRQSESTLQPILTCRFKEFTLKGKLIQEMFSSVDIRQIFSQAKIIKCQNRAKDFMKGWDAFKLLKIAKETLEECSLKIDFFSLFFGKRSINSNLKPIKILTLDKLVKFDLQFMVNNDLECENLDLLEEQCTIECPKIRELTLGGPVTSSFFKSLLGEDVEKIRLLSPSSDCIKLLSNCNNLTSLFVDVRGYKHYTQWHAPRGRFRNRSYKSYENDTDPKGKELRHDCNRELEEIIPCLPIKEFTYEAGWNSDSNYFETLMQAYISNSTSNRLQSIRYVGPDEFKEEEVDQFQRSFEKFSYKVVKRFPRQTNHKKRRYDQ